MNYFAVGVYKKLVFLSQKVGDPKSDESTKDTIYNTDQLT
jgi:hypothetical protein